MNYHYSNKNHATSVKIQKVDLDECLSKNYNLCIFSLGYESRCIDIPQRMQANHSNKLAYQFSHSQVLSFKDNEKWYVSENIRVVSIPHAEIETHIFTELNQINADNINILFDISSFDRAYIASFLYAFHQFSREHNVSIKVNICYSIANYTPPLEDGPVIKAGPVIPELAGWPRDPSLPTECCIGLGYEEGKALGALEYIEPKSTWLIKPIGVDPKFEESVDSANMALYNYSSKTRLINYKLDLPYATFIEIESLVSSFIDDSRPILVPFGPKIFFAISTLIALRNYPYISIWRVSADVNAEPVNREASGKICGLCATFQKISD